MVVPELVDARIALRRDCKTSALMYIDTKVVSCDNDGAEHAEETKS